MESIKNQYALAPFLGIASVVCVWLFYRVGCSLEIRINPGSWILRNPGRMFLWTGYRVKVAADFDQYIRKMEVWRNTHDTFGADAEELREHNDLVLEAVGAYMLWKLAEKEPVLDLMTERLLGEANEWLV